MPTKKSGTHHNLSLQSSKARVHAAGNLGVARGPNPRLPRLDELAAARQLRHVVGRRQRLKVGALRAKLFQLLNAVVDCFFCSWVR
jgi:hypothetical protein